MVPPGGEEYTRITVSDLRISKAYPDSFNVDTKIPMYYISCLSPIPRENECKW
jgi:hypothetical protein